MNRRRKDKSAPANPKDLTFVIPEDLSHLVLHDTGNNDKSRVLVLGHTDFYPVLEQALLFGDGTFECVPHIFFQLYTIHSRVGNSYPPCIYFLLPDKKRTTYDRMVGILKQLVPACNPERFLLDFEIAVHGAVSEGFPDCTISGCFFHLSQAVLRKVQSLGLKKQYESDKELNVLVRCLPALSFVPKEDVVQVFVALSQKFLSLEEVAEKCESLLAYFEETYIQVKMGRRGQTKKPPRFPIDVWNHFDSVQQDLPKTTNCTGQ